MKRPQMVQVLSSPYFSEHRPQIADLAIQYRLATMFIFKSYVRAGGLMSYGVDQMRRAPSGRGNPSDCSSS